MALINTTTTGVLGSTFFGDGTGPLTVQQNGQTLGIYGNIPTFSATTPTQAIGISTWTKLQFSTEQFDTNNNFDNTTNYRFTPTVAGYYSIHLSAGHGASGNGVLVAIYRNGSQFQVASSIGVNAVWDPSACVSAIIFFNGTTDYVEGYIFTNTNTNTQSTRFSGCLLKAV